MLGDARNGWLYSLTNEDPSHWGDLTNFYEYIGPSTKDRAKGSFVVKSKVWGKMLRKDCDPTPGDGFAFYHSKRANFGANDLYKRKPRISLVSKLEKIKRDGQKVDWIEVSVDISVFDTLRQSPIVRDESTQSIFQGCGIVPGPVASLYPAPHDPWQEIIALVRERMAVKS